MMVEVTDPNTGKVWTFHLDKKAKRFLDSKVIPSISKKDKDYVILIDGYEGSGKSTFAQQIGKYVDPTLDLDRICMTADEFKQAIIKASKGQCVIYDEAVTGMTAGDSISRIGKLLKSMMMQMRQKNLFVIIILPTIFELNRYTVMSRSRFFFHIYESKGRMGYWVGYNKKDTKKLYLYGRKNYTYKIRSFFNGRFCGKYTVDEEQYRKKKAAALFKLDEPDERKHKWLIQRDKIIIGLYKEFVKSHRKLSDWLKFHGVIVEKSEVGHIVGGKGNEEESLPNAQ